MTSRQVVSVTNPRDGEPLKVQDVNKAMSGLVPFEYDTVMPVYTGDKVTSVVYKQGGKAGRIVATLFIEYQGSKVISVERK